MREPGEASGLVRLEHVHARRRQQPEDRERAGDGYREQDPEMEPAHAGDEQRAGERRGEDERAFRSRAARTRARSARARSRSPAAGSAPPVGARPRSTRIPAIASTNSTSPNSDGWNWKKPMLIQRVAPLLAAPSTSTNEQRAEQREVEHARQPAEPRRVEEEHHRERDHADDRVERLPVHRRAAGIVARDAVDRVEPVQRDGDERSEQHPVEASDQPATPTASAFRCARSPRRSGV